MPAAKTTNKTQTISLRCQPSLKASLEQISREKNTTVSLLISSIAEEYIKSCEPNLTPSKSEYLTRIDYILFRNRIWNTISLEPNIPPHTKEKILKEMNRK